MTFMSHVLQIYSLNTLEVDMEAKNKVSEKKKKKKELKRSKAGAITQWVGCVL